MKIIVVKFNKQILIRWVRNCPSGELSEWGLVWVGNCPCGELSIYENLDTVDTLKRHFECTDWDIFVNSYKSIKELIAIVCEYVNFCEQNPMRKTEIFSK